MAPAENRPRIECPQCGAPLDVRSPAAVLAICEYCKTAAYWDEAGVRSAGEQASLTQGFTRLYRGAGGSLTGSRFEVVGRVRYRSPRAFWDEWFLAFDDERTAWLTEDDHLLAIQEPYESAHLEAIAQHEPGRRFELNDRRYEVEEVGEAECVGVEGQLPASILTGETYRFLDASSLDGELTLGIELDEEPPTGFLGRWLRHADVRLDDEGDDW